MKREQRVELRSNRPIGSSLRSKFSQEFHENGMSIKAIAKKYDRSYQGVYKAIMHVSHPHNFRPEPAPVPPPDAIAEARREGSAPLTIAQALGWDPLPGRSALDQKRMAGVL